MPKEKFNLIIGVPREKMGRGEGQGVGPLPKHRPWVSGFPRSALSVTATTSYSSSVPHNPQKWNRGIGNKPSKICNTKKIEKS